MPANQIKAGAVLNYIIIALNTLLGLLYTPYMLRMLGQSEFGLYSLVASVIAYLTILDFGFGNAIVRYTAKFKAEGKYREQWEMFGMFLIIYSIIGLIAFCCGSGLYLNIDFMFKNTMTVSEIDEARTMMLFLVFNLAITFPFSIFGSIITAYEDFIFQKVISIIRILLSTAIIILLLYVGYKAIALVVVQTIFNVLVLLLNYLYCKYKIGIKIIFNRFNWAFVKEISVYSFWIFLNSIVDKIYWGTGQFVLGAIVGPVAVAVFSVAILLENMYMTFSTSISSVLLPKVTSMISNNQSNKDISDLFIKTGRIQCIVMAFVLSGFIIFGQPFINIWAGNEYSGSYMITLVFFGTLFIPMVQTTGIIILQARNQMKFRSLLYCFISMFSLALQIPLAKSCGALGCAFAIGLAMILGQGVIMNIYYGLKQDIDIRQFWREIGKMMIIPVILVIVFYCLFQYLEILNLEMLLISIAIYSIIYIVLNWKYSLNDYERNLLYVPVMNILSRLRSHS